MEITEYAGALCKGGTGGTGGGGEVLLREVGGQGAAIDLSREKGRIRVEIRKGNAQNRPVSVLFVRIGVLVFGQSKHREFCTNTLEMPLAGSGVEGFSAAWWGMRSPIWVPLFDRSLPARNLTQNFFDFHFSQKTSTLSEYVSREVSCLAILIAGFKRIGHRLV